MVFTVCLLGLAPFFPLQPQDFSAVTVSEAGAEEEQADIERHAITESDNRSLFIELKTFY